MSITPDITRNIRDSCCSKCGQLLNVNNQAIIHEYMRDGASLVIGDCCADQVIGSLIQDFSDALTKYSVSVPSHWINKSSTVRARRIILALQNIATQYEYSINPYANDVQDMKNLSGGCHE